MEDDEFYKQLCGDLDKYDKATDEAADGRKSKKRQSSKRN
jgi:hypothetical protein